MFCVGCVVRRSESVRSRYIRVFYLSGWLVGWLPFVRLITSRLVYRSSLSF